MRCLQIGDVSDIILGSFKLDSTTSMLANPNPKPGTPEPLSSKGPHSVRSESQEGELQQETFTRRILTASELVLLQTIQKPLNTLLVEWPSSLPSRGSSKSDSDKIVDPMLDALALLHETLAQVSAVVMNYHGKIDLQQVLKLKEQLRVQDAPAAPDLKTRLEWVGDPGAKLRQLSVADQLCRLYIGFNETPEIKKAELEQNFRNTAWLLESDYAELGLESKAKLVLADLVSLLASQTGDVRDLGIAVEKAHSDLRKVDPNSVETVREKRSVYQGLLKVVEFHALETEWVRRLSAIEEKLAGNLAYDWCKAISVSQRELSTSLCKVLRSPVSLQIIESTIGALEGYGAIAMIPIVKCLNERQCPDERSEYAEASALVEQQFYLRILDALKNISVAEPRMLRRLRHVPGELAKKALSDLDTLNESGSTEQKLEYSLRLLNAAAAFGQEIPEIGADIAKIAAANTYSDEIRKRAAELVDNYNFTPAPGEEKKDTDS